MHSNDLGKKLCDVLGLPKDTKWFELRCAVNEAITIKCQYYVTANENEVIEALMEYKVVPRD